MLFNCALLPINYRLKLLLYVVVCIGLHFIMSGRGYFSFFYFLRVDSIKVCEGEECDF